MSDQDGRVRDGLSLQIRALIEKLATGDQAPDLRDSLLKEIAEYQRTRVQSYGRLWAQRKGAQQLGLMEKDKESGPEAGRMAPAMPTDVFRYARISSRPASEDVRNFRTSGTTAGARGEHCFSDLDLYDQAAEAAARFALFPDLAEGERIRLAILAPHADSAPHSSLSYMLGRFERWFGSETRFCWTGEALDLDSLQEAAAQAIEADEPLALLGTSFALVHAEDALGQRSFKLPAGSRIMQTGGFKGRSREVSPSALREALCHRYGVAQELIVSEYGMTELSSQMYENTLRATLLGGKQLGDERAPERRLWVPGWVRVATVDPESLQELAPGQEGLLRIDDCANLDSVCALQTSDRARIVDGGIILLGRAPGAVARGCSLAVEEALGWE